MNKRMVTEPQKKRKKIFKWTAAGILIFICTICFAGVYLLKRGVTIERLNLRYATVSESSLVWNDKLELQLGTVSINQGEQGVGNLSLQELVGRSVKTAVVVSRFLSKITIESIKIADQTIKIVLAQQQDRSYLLNLESETTKLDGLLEIDPHGVRIIVQSAGDARIDLKLSGQIQIEAKDATVSGSMIADIADSFPVELNFLTDDKKVSFWGAEAGTITNIKPFVDIFGLAQYIQKWITDYLSGSRYHLLSYKGEYVYGDPMSIFHSLEAEIMVDDASYIFEPDLEPIYDDHPRAYFKNGVLDIRLNNPVFYGHDGVASWVDINFNDPDNVLLTANIKAKTMVDDDILNLLHYYSIDIPFRQVGGETEADLRLSINLRSDEVSGEGSFFIDEGIITYEGSAFDVKDLRFSLKDSEVLLEQLEVRYEDIFVAHVTGQIHDKDEWDIDIDLEQLTFDLGKSKLRLDNTGITPDIGYHVSPEGHFLETSKSSWKLDSTAITLGGFRAPVNLDDLAAEIPPISLEILPGILAKVSGYFSIKKQAADFNCELQKYHVKDFKLEQPRTLFRIRYLDNLILDTKETSQWSLSNVPITFYPSELVYAENVLTTAASSFSYGNFFKSQFTGDYNTETRKGVLYLSRIELTHNDLGTEIDVGDRTLVEISEKEGTFVIDFIEFDLRIMTDDRGNWSAEFRDLSKIYNRSELLRTYKISSGSAILSSVNGNRPYNVAADIASPYPLLLQEGVVIDRLNIDGELTEEGFTATVNDTIQIDYLDGQLDIRSKNVGYNITAVRDLMDDFFDTPADQDEEDNGGVNLHLNAENSYLNLSPQSRVLADNIDLKYTDGELLMELRHGAGTLQLQRVGGIFFVNGEKLNDVFIEALIHGSYVQGGTLALAGMGSDDELSAVIEIQDTVLKDLQTLNSTMTLLNTLPALVTFSVPEYETKGLPVSSAIVGVKYSQNKVVFKSIALKSSVLQAAGQGWIDMANRQIDMDIQLTSQAGKNIRKIPIVGYVVAGGSDDSSVTLKIEGDLDNPEVRNSVLKEIATMPIDMLFRVLNLPIHFVKKLGTYIENDTRGSGNKATDEWQESDK
jgi:hypothetical protein